MNSNTNEQQITVERRRRVEEIRRTFEIFHHPGSVVEVRVIGLKGRGRPHTAAGYFDDFAESAEQVLHIDEMREPDAIYFTLNECDTALLARSPNKITDYLNPTTADRDIIRRRCFLIDIAPCRPSGVSSTEDEVAAACTVVHAIRDWLTTEMNWPAPVEAMSGNGHHLLYWIDLLNDEESRRLCEAVLHALDTRFCVTHPSERPPVAVDRTVFNAARITKLYGTMVRKGESVGDRPHRRSRLLRVPDDRQVVSVDQLQAVAALAPHARKGRVTKTSGVGHRLLVKKWLMARNIEFRVKDKPSADGRTVYILDHCQFNDQHGGNGEVCIMQEPGGKLSAKCMHDGCAGKGWKEFRDAIGRPAADHFDPPLGGNGDTSPENKGKIDLLSPSPDELSSFEPFPTEVLPVPLCFFVREGAAALGCDESMIALPLLSAVAGAIGNTRRIQLKRTWVEPAILWLVVVAESETLKSPAWHLAMQPLHRRQTAAFRDHSEKLEQHLRDLIDYKAALDEWKKTGRKHNEPQPDEPDEPIPDRYLCEDTTVEALAVLLQRQPRGLLMARDELGGWVNGFDAYKSARGVDVTHWLSMHRTGPLTVDRKTVAKKTIHVPRAAVSIAGTVQPATLSAALTGRYDSEGDEAVQKVSGEHFANGLAARLLLAMPTRKTKRWTEAIIDPATEAAIEDLFERLLALDFTVDQFEEQAPIDLQFTPDGKREWVRFYDEHADEQAELYGDLAAAWAKLEGYTARFALIIHLVRSEMNDPTLEDPASVDGASVRAGIRLSRWFADEASRVYALIGGIGDSAENRERRKLVRLIRDKGGPITVRELMRSCRSFRSDAQIAEAALNDLVQAGVGTWQTVETAGRPKRAFVFL